jgi:hypothetical protein
VYGNSVPLLLQPKHSHFEELKLITVSFELHENILQGFVNVIKIFLNELCGMMVHLMTVMGYISLIGGPSHDPSIAYLITIFSITSRLMFASHQ